MLCLSSVRHGMLAENRVALLTPGHAPTRESSGNAPARSAIFSVHAGGVAVKYQPSAASKTNPYGVGGYDRLRVSC